MAPNLSDLVATTIYRSHCLLIGSIQELCVHVGAFACVCRSDGKQIAKKQIEPGFRGGGANTWWPQHRECSHLTTLALIHSIIRCRAWRGSSKSECVKGPWHELWVMFLSHLDLAWCQSSVIFLPPNREQPANQWRFHLLPDTQNQGFSVLVLYLRNTKPTQKIPDLVTWSGTWAG